MQDRCMVPIQLFVSEFRYFGSGGDPYPENRKLARRIKLEPKSGFCILNLFALIVGLSKCDFWNLWKILVRHGYFFFSPIFFRDEKFSRKNRKTFFGDFFEKNRKFSIFP